MKKWAGFFLSDHSLKINKDNQKRRTVYCKKSPMTQNEIRKSLMKSFAEHRQIAVQIKEITEDNQVKPNIIGFVEGYQEDAAIISNHFVNIMILIILILISKKASLLQEQILAPKIHLKKKSIQARQTLRGC